MDRRQILVVGTVVLAVVVVAIAFIALGDREPSASAPPSPSPSPTVDASASPSASASEAPSESASPSAAAGPFTVAWEPVEFEAGADINDVSFVGDRWFALGQVFPEAAIWTSDDGRTWARAEIASTRADNEVTAVTDVVEFDGLLVAIGAFGMMDSDQFAWMTWTSDDDGATWTERRDGPSPHALRAILAAGPGLIGAGWDYAGTTPFDSWIAASEDAVTWERTPVTFPISEAHSLAVLEDRIVAVGNVSNENRDRQAAAWYSDDGGATWASAELAGDIASETLYEVIATPGGFIAVAGGPNGASAWVGDGEAWERIEIATSAEAWALATVDAGYVAVGNVVGQDIGPGLSWTSVDGSTWEAGTEFSPGSVRIIAAGGNASTVLAGGQCLSDSCDTVLWVGEVSR